MSEPSNAVVALGVAGLLLGVGAFIYSRSGAPVVAGASPAPPSSSTRTTTVTRFVPVPVGHGATAIAAPVDVAQLATNVALQAAAPFATTAAATALEAAGSVVSSTSANVIAPTTGGAPIGIAAPQAPVSTGFTSSAANDTESSAVGGSATLSPLGAAGGAVGGALTSAGQDLGGVNPIVGVIAVDAAIAGFRGASEETQAKILGQSTVQAVGSVISAAIPGVGALLGKGLSLLADTGTGAQIVGQVGQVEEVGYVAQKEIVAGDVSAAFSGGGTSEAQRQEEEAQAITAGRATATAASAAQGGRGILGPGGEVDVSYAATPTVAVAEAKATVANAKAQAAQAQVSATALSATQAQFALTGFAPTAAQVDPLTGGTNLSATPVYTPAVAPPKYLNGATNPAWTAWKAAQNAPSAPTAIASL